MERLRLKIAVFASLVLVLYLLPIWISVPLDESNMLNAYLDKKEAVKRIEVQKVLLVGGSNTAFGFDSKEIEEALERPVVNMGLHAGLGLNFIMKDALRDVSPGDVVILSPEYQQFKGMFYGRVELLMLVNDVAPDAKEVMSQNDWWELRSDIPIYTGAWYWRVLKQSIVGPQKASNTSYSREAYNSYGDVVAHHGSKARGVPIRKLGGAPNEDYIAEMAVFRDKVREKGATFLFAYPPYPKNSFEQSMPFINAFDSLLYKHLSPQEILGTAADNAFNDSLFFNSVYHLTQQGKYVRTQQLIEEVQKGEPDGVRKN